MIELRCPCCSKLLARIAADGAAIIVIHGIKIAAIRDGDVVCTRCGKIVSIKEGSAALAMSV